jgi:quercetin dioxygenase-like cupin family protein
MNSRTLLIGGVVVFALAVTLAANGMASAETAPVKFTNILQSDLQNLPHQETIVQALEVAPGAVMPWHMHPDGHEITYVIEGSAVLELEGQPPRTARAGEGWHIQANVPHGGRNGSTTEPLRLVIVRIKPKDKPATVPMKK